MTCSECVELLVTRDVESAVDGAKGHLAECVACTRAAELIMAGQRALAESLDAEHPSITSNDVAQTSWIKVRRMRVRRWIIAGAIAATAVTLGLLGRYAMPEVRSLLAPPPPVVTATFSLKCLSSDQAAVLLRPYLPLPQNPRWQAESFSVTPAPRGIRAVTVRAPRETMDLVPSLLARFEEDPGAACRR